MNYKNGKIYSIRSHQTDKIYIGSTTQPLSKRLSAHKTHFRAYLDGKYHKITSFDIIEYGDAYIELLEECPCETKDQLHKREGECIRAEPNCINRCVAGRSQKEYREQNTDKLREKNKQYREQNTDKLKEYRKQYRELNRDTINENQNKYREQNADKVKEYRKLYYEQNADKIKEHSKQYREQNADKYKEYREQNADKLKEYHKQYRENKRKMEQQDI